MPKKVTYAQLHDGFFVPGMKNGQFDKTLPPANKTLDNLEMELQDSGALSVSWADGKYRKSITVAAANIKIVMHPSESEVKAAVAKDPLIRSAVENTPPPSAKAA